MKKLFLIVLVIAILSGCTAQTEVVSEVTTSISESRKETASQSGITTTAISVSETTAATAETLSEKLIDSQGMLTKEYLTILKQLFEKGSKETIVPEIALHDFDDDGIPEIIFIYSNGGQGNMPCKVYRAKDGEYLGEFSGFCRDGYTRFSKGYGGTIVHNYYEHSNWQRVESFDLIKIYNDSLNSENIYNRYGLLNYGECYPTMGYTEEINEKYIQSSVSIEFIGEQQCRCRLGEEYAVTTYGYYDIDQSECAETVFKLYNDYKKLENMSINKSDIYYVFAPGDYDGDMKPEAFFQNNDGVFFIDSSGNTTQLAEETFYNIHKLWYDAIVFEPWGATYCEAYTVKDGKAEQVIKLGRGISFDYSELYNGYYEVIHSVYDGLQEGGISVGCHSFKKYLFCCRDGGLKECGAITVNQTDFFNTYGESAEKIRDEIEAEGVEITEILYRDDVAFLVNYRIAAYESDSPVYYYMLNKTYKPCFDNKELKEIDSNDGVYLTALVPEIAIYPEEMYVPELP